MVGVAVVLVTAVLFWKFSPLGSPKLDPKRIAVMPFQTQGQPGGSEYLGTMIADAIAANLVTSPDLAVLPASELGAGRRGRATMRDYLSAGQRLGAGRCIVGRVARTGDSLQLSVSLLDGARGTLLWGQVVSSHDASMYSTVAPMALRRAIWPLRKLMWVCTGWSIAGSPRSPLVVVCTCACSWLICMARSCACAARLF